jgi:hypothetical protein
VIGIAKANPLRANLGLKIVLEFVPAFDAPLEAPTRIVIHDLLMIMTGEPAQVEEGFPSVHLPPPHPKMEHERIMSKQSGWYGIPHFEQQIASETVTGDLQTWHSAFSLI